MRGLPTGWKIRNTAQYGTLDPTKLVMVASSYDGNIIFMDYGLSSSQCFSNFTTWAFYDYYGAASDEVVSMFTR